MNFILNGERNFFISQLENLYTHIGIKNCKTRVLIHYDFCSKPTFQERCHRQAASEWYVYDSEMNPARKGLKCQFEDCMCDGSDNVGCTYCRMPRSAMDDWMSFDDDFY